MTRVWEVTFTDNEGVERTATIEADDKDAVANLAYDLYDAESIDKIEED